MRMITFKTKSGSTYKVDTANKRMLRVPNADREHLTTAHDAQWVAYEAVAGLQEGCYAHFEGAQFGHLYTTQITELTTE